MNQPGVVNAGTPFVAPDGEERLAQFVAMGDLSGLPPIEAEKAVSEFNNYQLSAACCCNAIFLPCGYLLLAPGAFCLRDDITKKSYLSLDAEKVEILQPKVDFCCHIAKQKRTVPLDIVTDVEVRQGWLERRVGVKSVRVRTASGMGS